MKGLELSEKFFNEYGLPAFREAVPEMMDHLTFGLVGQGSECFGFDDEISRDHDWGPGFCVWVPSERFQEWAPKLTKIYASLPKNYEGFAVKGVASCNGDQRVGVLDGDMFLYQFIGLKGVAGNNMGWFRAKDEAYAVVSNGKLFTPNKTKFSLDYADLKAGYPDDVRIKKIAARAVKMAQSGQYNYVRSMKRGNKVAAFQSLNEFVKETCGMIHLLNHTYCPFYKWMWRSLEEQPVLGAAVKDGLEQLVMDPYSENNKDAIEDICLLVKKELQAESLTDSEDDFLEPHGVSIMSRIRDPQLRMLPVSWDC